jgi:opacity protein-like surface antigen
MSGVRTDFTTIVAACMLTAPFVAHAQDSRPVQFGVMGGATLPVGILRDASKVGWNAGALVNVGASESPLRFRVDGQWHQLGGGGGVIGCSFTPGGGFCPEPVDVRIIDGTANVVYTVGSNSPTCIYLLAGAGVYGERATAPANGSRGNATKFGLNAGIGLRFFLSSSLGGFVEARYHNVLHGSDVGDYAKRSTTTKSLQFIPISAGITF